MVSTTPTTFGATVSVSNQALKLLSDAVSSSDVARRQASPGLGFKSAESTVGGAAMAKIQELTRSASLSPEREAMARVKDWVKSGMARDAAAGRTDAWLKEMAAQDKLGSLPPLSAEQEKTLSTEELRVYVEARYWQAMYSGPRTMEAARQDYAKSVIPGMEEYISRASEQIRSGAIPAEVATDYQHYIDETKAKVDAFKAGRFSFIQADSGVMKGDMHSEFIRDGGGLVIGGRATGYIDGNEIQQKYVRPGQLWDADYSAHLGTYVVVFDVA